MQEKDYLAWFKQRFKRTSSFYSGIMLALTDSIVIMLCFGISFFIINWIDHSLISFRSFVNYWVYLPAFIAVFYASGLYPGTMIAPADEVRRFCISSLFCFAGIALSIAVETDDRTAISVALLLAIPIATGLLPLGREFVRKQLCRRPWWGVPAVIYCTGDTADVIIKRLQTHPEFGYRPALIINIPGDTQELYDGIPVLPYTSTIHEIIHKLNIKVAIIVESDKSFDTTDSNFSFLMNLYRYTIIIPRSMSINSVSMSVRDFGGILGFATTHNLTKAINLFAKRAIDLFLLAISSPVILPLLIVLALLVKITSPGPVFFGHKRIGKNGKMITTWKFRSMVTNAQELLDVLLKENPVLAKEWNANQKLANDPRVTKIGRFLRKTSLDELPQFWNILLGQMSFVGPRPIVQAELEKYGTKAEYIFSVKPGLSGMWQISGRSETGYEERIMLDTYYIQNWSIWLDIWIIIKTIWVVLKGKGAY